jgi:hypothetical protein
MISHLSGTEDLQIDGKPDLFDVVRFGNRCPGHPLTKPLWLDNFPTMAQSVRDFTLSGGTEP